MGDPDRRPAFYAAGPGGWRDWWTVLHPPYTAWHLSYVVIGASLVSRLDGPRLLLSVGAFFAAVGVAAHALDERHDRPLRTQIPDRSLTFAVVVGLAVAVGLGVVNAFVVGWGLVPFLVIGPLLVVAYNLELFGGIVHTDVGFAASWGAFPVLAGYAGQQGTMSVAAVAAAIGAFALSYAQRALSTPARQLRRRVDQVEGTVTLLDGSIEQLDVERLLAPLERALRALTWATVALAVALVLGHVARP